jgi:hypothetical protein
MRDRCRIRGRFARQWEVAMNTARRIGIVALAMFAALVLALPADASRGGGGHSGGGRGGGGGHGSGAGHSHHGGHHHHHRGGGVFFIGAVGGFWPWWSAGAYGPVLYDVPAWLPEPLPGPVPLMQQAPASPEGYWWYWCEDSQAYYPYVQQCASEWQRVVPK